MVGHWEMGVPLSSMNDKSLSNQALLVGSSSISYSLCRFSTLACGPGVPTGLAGIRPHPCGEPTGASSWEEPMLPGEGALWGVPGA